MPATPNFICTILYLCLRLGRGDDSQRGRRRAEMTHASYFEEIAAE